MLREKEEMIQFKIFHSEEWKYKIIARAVGTHKKIKTDFTVRKLTVLCWVVKTCVCVHTTQDTTLCMHRHTCSCGLFCPRLCGTSSSLSSRSRDFIFASAAHLLWTLEMSLCSLIHQIIPFNQYYWMLMMCETLSRCHGGFIRKYFLWL